MHGSYSIFAVALSVGVAMLSSYTALDLAGRVAQTKGKAARLWTAGGACAMGLGIWAMHFIGMLALTLPMRMTYDLPTTAGSLLVAIVVSGFALDLVSRRQLSKARLAFGALLMGAGISSMHYLGMAAMQFDRPVSYNWTIFAASIAVAIVASLAALWIAFSLRDEKSGKRIYARIGAAALMGLAIAGMHYTGMAAASFDPNAICVGGFALDNGWTAAVLALVTSGILTLTLMLSMFDARMALRTGEFVTTLQHANAELRHLATHDSLTHLPNRVLMEDRIAQAISHSVRNGLRFALLFVDLDRFKAVNDSLGHHAGDRLLQTVASRLSAVVRGEDTVARVGGDEFVVVLHGIADAGVAAGVARKMLDALEEEIELEGLSLRLSASVGISVFPDDGSDANALVVSADAAMNHAKQNGRGNFQFFAREMNTFARERFELEGDLRRALEQKQFEVYFQPKVDVSTGEIVSMEALLRWHHPLRGLIMPADFIPLAEESGLIVPIGEWVLDAACRQNQDWQDGGMKPMRISVNLSAAQFHQRNLFDVVTGVLAKSGMAPQYLELEITESTVMTNPTEATAVLDRLSAVGVHISIDDFGTGYSSLAYLKRLPLGTLKIDRAFIRDVTSSVDDASIVRAVISLAHSLRLKVTAEGVETGAQLSFLRALGCDEFQGYLCSPPVSGPQFRKLVETGLPVTNQEIPGVASSLQAVTRSTPLSSR